MAAGLQQNVAQQDAAWAVHFHLRDVRKNKKRLSFRFDVSSGPQHRSGNKDVFLLFTFGCFKEPKTTCKCSVGHLERRSPLSERPTAQAYITCVNLKENSLFLENFLTQSWESEWVICGCVVLRFHRGSLRQDSVALAKFNRVSTQSFFPSLCRWVVTTQALDSSFEFRKVALSTASTAVSALLPLSVSLQVTEEVLSSRPGGRFLHETRLLRLLSAFGARFPITLPEDPSGGGSRGMTRRWDDTVAPFPATFPKNLQNRLPLALLDLDKVRLSSLRSADSDSISSLGHTFAHEQWCVPSLRPVVSCSPLVQLFSHTPVIGWSLAVSLLLLSHSGASVVAVENRYPCLFFFVFTQIKIPMN